MKKYHKFFKLLAVYETEKWHRWLLSSKTVDRVFGAITWIPKSNIAPLVKRITVGQTESSTQYDKLIDERINLTNLTVVVIGG